MAGRSALLQGVGGGFNWQGNPRGSALWASEATGPVLDLVDMTTFGGFIGKARMGGFALAGSRQGDPTGALSGLRARKLQSIDMYGIAIKDTGGPCVDFQSAGGNAVYLSSFRDFTLSAPVDVVANDMPYARLQEANSNLFEGWGFMGAHPSAARPDIVAGGPTSGVSGAMQVNMIQPDDPNNTAATPFQTTYTSFDRFWFENIIVPQNGTVVESVGSRGCTFSDFLWQDTKREEGHAAGVDAGTSHFRFKADPNGARMNAGNLVRGKVLGNLGDRAFDMDCGVEMLQNGNSVDGSRAGIRNIVRIRPGVRNTDVRLTGMDSATDVRRAVWDESGNATNRARDVGSLADPVVHGADVPVGSHLSLPVASTSSATPPLWRQHFVPVMIPRHMTFDRISIEVVTPVAGSTAWLSLYASDASGVRPGALIVSPGAVVTETVGVASLTHSRNLSPGLVWVGITPRNTGTPENGAATLRTVGAANIHPVTSDTPSFSGMSCYTLEGISSAVADATGMALIASPDAPALLIRRSA